MSADAKGPIESERRDMISKIMDIPGVIPVLTILLSVLMIYAADKALRLGKPPAIYRWFIPVSYVMGGAFGIVGVGLIAKFFTG